MTGHRHDCLPTTMKLAAKVEFLKNPANYPRHTDSITVRETHTAMIFIARDRVYKMKKRVRFPFLDFERLDRREYYCREEVRINRELAGAMYRGVVPLVRAKDGKLHFGGKGHVVDWLIEMDRLPEREMLDNRLLAGQVSRAEIGAVASVLSRFYRRQQSAHADAASYMDHLLAETAINSEHLHALRHFLDGRTGNRLAGSAIALLERHEHEIKERIASGLVVDGHGDLRPEHVCLTDPPVIFDRLEFDPHMRLIDIYDEIGYLALECELLGAAWVGPFLIETVEREIGSPPSAGLMKTYRVFRALLHARLAIDHLRDKSPRTPEKWPGQARIYLDAARRQIDEMPSAARP